MPLFFQYVCFIFVSLIVSYITYGIYSTINFTSGDYCMTKEEEEPGYCGARWKTQVSAGNTAFWDFNGYEKAFATLLYFSLFFTRMIFFRMARKQDNEIDEDLTTPSDFTVKISGLPMDITKKEIVEIFSQLKHKDGKQVKIQKINLAYRIGEFIENAKLRINYSRQLSIEKEKEDKDEEKIKELQKKLDQTVKKLQQIQKKFSHGKNGSSQLFSGICFLSFKTQADCSLVLNKWGMSHTIYVLAKNLNFLQSCLIKKTQLIKGHLVYVTTPPEPLDVLWENLGTPFATLFKTRFVTGFLSSILLGVSFACILGMKFWQVGYLKDGNDGWTKTLLSFGITFMISFVGTALGTVLRLITAKEKFESMTSYNIGVTKRIAIVTKITNYFRPNL